MGEQVSPVILCCGWLCFFSRVSLKLLFALA